MYVVHSNMYVCTYGTILYIRRVHVSPCWQWEAQHHFQDMGHMATSQSRKLPKKKRKQTGRPGADSRRGGTMNNICWRGLEDLQIIPGKQQLGYPLGQLGITILHCVHIYSGRPSLFLTGKHQNSWQPLCMWVVDSGTGQSVSN